MTNKRKIQRIRRAQSSNVLINKRKRCIVKHAREAYKLTCPMINYPAVLLSMEANMLHNARRALLLNPCITILWRYEITLKYLKQSLIEAE